MMRNNILSFFIFLLFTLSFSLNFLNVSNNFTTFQNDSEHLVIDGLNHNNLTGETLLGIYISPGGALDPEFYEKSITHFESTTSPIGNFSKYTSQYGLQLDFFSFISKSFNIKSVKALKIINALIFSFVMLLIFRWISSNVGKVPSYIFVLSIILSPWMVNFSNNLYWVPFTWFIPFVISLLFSLKMIQSKMRMVILFFMLTLAFYIKFMCGFEYITTIGMMSVTPVLYFYLRKMITLKISLTLIVIIFLSFISAFSLSGFSYINKFGDEKLKQIVIKRVDTGSIHTIEDCNDAGLKSCKALVASLNSNPIKVVGRYFIFDNFLPYTGVDNSREIREIKVNSSKWKEFKKSPSLSSWNNLDERIKKQTIYRFFSMGVNFFIFLSLILLSCFFLLKSQDKDKYKHMAAFIFLMLCPISWYLLAKGHSYIHTHMNYVLWYMPTVPVMLIYIYQNINVKKLAVKT